MFSLTFNFMEIFYDHIIELTNSLQKVENFIGDNSKSFPKSSFPKIKEMSILYQNLKSMANNYFQKHHATPEKKSRNEKMNIRIENSLQKIEKNELLKDQNFENLMNSSSLNKIKENFEIDVSNRSISNKLGLKFKSNKMETPNEFGLINIINRQKAKPGSLNDFFDFEKVLLDKKQNNTDNVNHPYVNFRSSLDSNRLIKNYSKVSVSSNNKDDCDQRFLDIISLNERKKKEEKTEELNISDNLTENLNETSQIVNKLSSREERAIIKETLKKYYKCQFHQLSDSKSLI